MKTLQEKQTREVGRMLKTTSEKLVTKIDLLKEQGRN